jgi:hypothetical protein
MPTLSREAIEIVRSDLESKDEIINQLEEELSEALEEVATLRAQIMLMMTDRSVAV